MAINTTIKAIQDIVRQDAGVDGDAQRISQLTWMLFLKIFDDREKEYELDDRYVSPIPRPRKIFLRWGETMRSTPKNRRRRAAKKSDRQ